MIIKTVKNAGFFLTIFILILGINLGGINNGFTIMSFAQETGEMGETEGILETDEAQETLATEDTMGAEEIDQVEGEAEAEEEEELDISLIAEYITYEKIEGEDLIIAKDGVEFKYQDIEVKACLLYTSPSPRDS